MFCQGDFGYNDTVCDNLNTEEYETQNIEVSNAQNDYNVLKTWVTSIVPVFMAFYLGAWADLFGRKLLFYIFLSTSIMKQCIVIICAYFFDTPKEYLLLSEIPSVLSGGYAAWSLAINAFISDISSPENRAFRYGMLHLIEGLGRPLASPLGAYLLRTGGFVCVFSTSLVGIVLGSILCIYRIRAFKWNPPKESHTKKRNAFSPLLILDAFRATFRKRLGPNRKYLLLTMVITTLTFMPFMGEGTVSYSYVKVRYNWGVDEYSTYSSVISASNLATQAIVIPFIKYLNINEALVLIIVLTCTLARHLLKALAVESWMYYLGAIIDISGYAFAIVRSMLSCCVAPDELGKVFSLLSAVDSMIPIGISKGYAAAYKAYIETIPGMVFFISTGISGMAWALAIYIFVSLKGRKMSEVTEKGANAPLEKRGNQGLDNLGFEKISAM